MVKYVWNELSYSLIAIVSLESIENATVLAALTFIDAFFLKLRVRVLFFRI